MDIQITDDKHGNVQVAALGWLRARLQPGEPTGLKISLYKLYQLASAGERQGMWLTLTTQSEVDQMTAWLREVADKIDELAGTWIAE
jgi:hypothetical protein